MSWDGYTLIPYQETIRKALSRECRWMRKSGLAEFLTNVLLKRKIVSMTPEVKEWKGQCKDGFGEGFSQREIRIREGLLHVYFCGSLWNFKIQTEQEMKGEVKETHKMQLKSLR